MSRKLKNSCRVSLGILIALNLAFVTGCGDSGGGSQAAGGVAVVDMDAVAKDLGRDIAIAQELQQYERSLDADLRGRQANYEQIIKEEELKLGVKPSDEDKGKFALLQQKVGMEFRQRVQQASNDLQARRGELIRKFREDISPTALKVAESRGMTVVMIKHEGILDNAKSADITEDVVKALKVAGYASSGSASSSPSPATPGAGGDNPPASAAPSAPPASPAAPATP